MKTTEEFKQHFILLGIVLVLCFLSWLAFVYALTFFIGWWAGVVKVFLGILSMFLSLLTVAGLVRLSGVGIEVLDDDE